MNMFALIGVVVVSAVAYLLPLLMIMFLVGGGIDSEEAAIGSIILGASEAIAIGLLLAKMKGMI